MKRRIDETNGFRCDLVHQTNHGRYLRGRTGRFNHFLLGNITNGLTITHQIGLVGWTSIGSLEIAWPITVDILDEREKVIPGGFSLCSSIDLHLVDLAHSDDSTTTDIGWASMHRRTRRVHPFRSNNETHRSS